MGACIMCVIHVIYRHMQYKQSHFHQCVIYTCTYIICVCMLDTVWIWTIHRFCCVDSMERCRAIVSPSSLQRNGIFSCNNLHAKVHSMCSKQVVCMQITAFMVCVRLPGPIWKLTLRRARNPSRSTVKSVAVMPGSLFTGFSSCSARYSSLTKIATTLL